MSRLDFSGLEAPPLLPGEAAQAPLHSFEEDPDQPRTEFSGPDFDELVEDIRQRGILQPIVAIKTAAGRLRIRFGARRFRAAKLLEMASVPYVLSTDPRQLDDYAQVSENEKRTNLQPLELAMFIKRKIEQEPKQDVAAKLGIARSTLTYSLAMIDLPAFLAEAYESRKCRSAKFFYQLRGLHAKQPKLVEERISQASTVDFPFIVALEREINSPTAESSDPESDLAQQRGSSAEVNGSTHEVAPGPAAILRPPAKVSQAASNDRLVKPLLRATYERKPVILLLGKRPSKEGFVHVKLVKGDLIEEVAFDKLTALHLTEGVEL